MESRIYDSLPDNVKDILSTFDCDAEAYTECSRVTNELREIGYTCALGLDGELVAISRKVLDWDIQEDKILAFYDGGDDFEEVGTKEDVIDFMIKEMATVPMCILACEGDGEYWNERVPDRDYIWEECTGAAEIVKFITSKTIMA